ncbi:MAG: hypothetical protein HYY61_03015 [Deltaproteobacteria bacterium]|nr:hypothetical protein [Deltaproteobacteria bacterium]
MMNSYLKLHSFFNILFLLFGLPLAQAKEKIFASEIRAFINNSQVSVQEILEQTTPPSSTKLKDLTASVQELNVLGGISSSVTSQNLNTLVGGSSSDADSLHVHSGGVGNAGTLDTLDSVQFLRADADDTFEGNTLSLDGDLQLNSGGSFVTSSNGNITINPNGTGLLKVGTSDNTTAMDLKGDLSVSGDISNPLILSLKMEVQSLNNMIMELQSANSFPPMIKDIQSIKESFIIKDTQPVTLNNSLLVKGNLQVEGPIQRVFHSKNFGPLHTFGTQALRPYMDERGEAALIKGEALIYLSAPFLELVTIDQEHPLFVKITLLTADNSNPIAVVERTSKYFRVKELYGGESNVSFLWEASAERKEEKE